MGDGGTPLSLRVGVLAVLMALVSGSTLGLIAGYAGRWVDGLFMRFMDIVLAFPSTLLAIGIVAMRGPSLEMALVAIGIVSIPVYARLARSMALSLRQREYVTAARCLGASDARIIGLHILPNALSPLIVQATLGIATAIIEAAGLGFLGLGAQPPAPEWGLMLTNGRAFLINAPWAMIFPGLAIMLTTLAFNLIGDGVRDALDPHLRAWRTFRIAGPPRCRPAILTPQSSARGASVLASRRLLPAHALEPLPEPHPGARRGDLPGHHRGAS